MVQAGPCLLAALHLGLRGTGGASGAQGRCRDGVTDARALRAVMLTTLALHGKFLVLVSVTSLCYPWLIMHGFTTDTPQSLGSCRPPARGCRPRKRCAGAGGEFQQLL